MKKIIKKTTSLIVAAALIFGSVAATVQYDKKFLSAVSPKANAVIEKTITVGDLEFIIEDNQASLRPVSGRSIERVEIPSSVEGYPVVKIRTDTFKNCSQLKEVIIPDSVTCIEASAFERCTALESIFIPKSVKTIGKNAFFLCTSLTEFVVDEENENYCSSDGVLFSKDMKTLIVCPCRMPKTEYEIPDGVVTISNFAFASCFLLADVKIPDSVRKVGSDAFSGTWMDRMGTNIRNYGLYVDKWLVGIRNIKSGLNLITVEDGTVGIASETFWNKDMITDVVIPDSVVYMGYEVFSGCEKLSDIYYYGSEQRWDAIEMGVNNRIDKNKDFVDIHFDYDGHHIHDYFGYKGMAATCETDGYVLQKCECGEEQMTVTKAFGHEPRKMSSVSPTYEKEGSKGGVICKRCEKILEEPTIVPKVEYPSVKITGTDGTCIKGDKLVLAAQTKNVGFVSYIWEINGTETLTDSSCIEVLCNEDMIVKVTLADFMTGEPLNINDRIFSDTVEIKVVGRAKSIFEKIVSFFRNIIDNIKSFFNKLFR